MQTLMFTKMLKGMTLAEKAAALRKLGLDGMDLAIRKGFPVNPANVRQAFPEAVKVCADHGLIVGMVTTEGFWTSADAPGLETTLEAMAANGCRLVKPGYWPFKPEESYWTGVDRVRKDLDGLAKLAVKHGVTWLFHTHSGPYYGATCGSLWHVIAQFDPRLVKAYIDPGHLGINGETLDMVVSMVKDRLGAVAVKNLCWAPAYEPGGRWQRLVVPLDKGLVDWGRAIKLLREVGFNGPLSIHSEYDGPPDQVLAWTQHDLKHLRDAIRQT